MLNQTILLSFQGSLMDTHTKPTTRWYHAVAFAFAHASVIGGFFLMFYMANSLYLWGGITLAFVLVAIAAWDVFSQVFQLMKFTVLYAYKRSRIWMSRPKAWQRLRAYAFLYAPFCAARMSLVMFGPLAALLLVSVLLPHAAALYVTDIRVLFAIWLMSIAACFVAMGFALKWSAKITDAAFKKEKTIYHPAFLQKLAARGL